MRKDAPGPASGFSLVESMIVVAILAILAGLALPSLQALVLRQRIATTGYTLATELSLARNTAISRRTPVTLGPSRGDGRCRSDPDWSEGWLLYRDPQRATQLAQARNTAISRRIPVTACPSLGDDRCRPEPDWSAGWLLYLDPSRSPQPRSTDDILRQERQPLHDSVRVSASAGRVRVRYQPDGRSGGNNLTLRVCSAGTLHGEVIVNNVGRVRTRRPGPGAPCPPP